MQMTSNFAFLEEHDPLFVELATGAERASTKSKRKARKVTA